MGACEATADADSIVIGEQSSARCSRLLARVRAKEATATGSIERHGQVLTSSLSDAEGCTIQHTLPGPSGTPNVRRIPGGTSWYAGGGGSRTVGRVTSPSPRADP